ncbi:NAD(P)(+) transhydrogenase (Re/Si-specific) subunit beta [Ferruginibacter sp.]|uniref:NAD(P)(+) transhydrogenase (Re/Si-specific) subunit beta n=1 Tax=Ferruginibacter sp. TaxID=1940288 RepID=UPI001983C99B|nr:NAD(P)(+) transhydrogenase (Re/Si-specific) subunit beta [Ferruginibacter sp.]MBC7627079.1 NAD(P)(+) transhydrogenase (Re/Si-specific) subunit beta [Ferruginibacter sp.]
MALHILTICYLIASVTFILGLKMLSHPESARRGNLVAAAGMTIGIFGTIFLFEQEVAGRPAHLNNTVLIFVALTIGAILGFISAKKIKMTAMPEMVSLFNGMGGACAMLISIIEFNHYLHTAIRPVGNLIFLTEELTTVSIIAIVAGLVIGSISFAGSIVAWGKLRGIVGDTTFKGQRNLNMFFLLVLAAAVVTFIIKTPVTSDELSGVSLPGGAVAQSSWAITSFHIYLFYGILALSLLYGVLFVLPIGGADMPVVISLLNSFTGVAAACAGFMYNNQAMLTGGILVGAAGTLLTILMCKAMNRSLLNVIVGSWGETAAAAGATSNEQGAIKEISLSDASMVMSYATKVLIVPGYGLAVAQAQHICHELEKILEEKGVEVKYAIHPVAGRMPGHMNVLLAEADVSYEKLLEMEDANDEFKTTDVVLVLGANDVVNPAAKNDPESPIYGMPILEVQQAKTVIVNKRSMKPGYAGIENDLFFQPKTAMLFGDAKKVLQNLCAEIKAG